MGKKKRWINDARISTSPLNFTNTDDYGKPPITNYGMMEETPIIIGLWQLQYGTTHFISGKKNS
jgi:hypothetical protein